MLVRVKSCMVDLLEVVGDLVHAALDPLVTGVSMRVRVRRRSCGWWRMRLCRVTHILWADQRTVKGSSKVKLLKLDTTIGEKWCCEKKETEEIKITERTSPTVTFLEVSMANAVRLGREVTLAHGKSNKECLPNRREEIADQELTMIAHI